MSPFVPVIVEQNFGASLEVDDGTALPYGWILLPI